MPKPITLYVQNLSAVVQHLAGAFRVLLDQANNDLHLHWPDAPYVEKIVEVRPEDRWPKARWPKPEDGVWRATIYDYPTQALEDDDLAYIPVGALSGIGYHFPDNEFPHLVVFAANGQHAGIPWTMTLSHELLEALVDPSGEELMKCPGKRKSDEADEIYTDYYEKEICDPVQAQAYPLDDPESGETFWVSNFVTPEWFGKIVPPPRDPNIRYDFAGQLVSARQRSLGGVRTVKLADGRDRSEALTRLGSVVATGE